MSTLDLLKVVNTDSSKSLILRHDGKGDVTIEPGRHRILPAEYAYLSFGDPRAYNQGKDKSRDIEFSNARTLWGFYPGMMPEAAWDGVGVTNEGDQIGPFKPSYECYDMDDQRVYLVIDDPDGTKAAELTGTPTFDQSDRIEQDAMHALIAAQGKQIEELRNLVLLSQQGGIAGPGPDIEEPDEDDEFEPEEDDLDEPEEGSEVEVDEPETPPVVARVAKAAKTTPAARKAAAKVGKAAPKGSQAARNEQRDEIPKAPADEPPVAPDNPGTTRVGGR